MVLLYRDQRIKMLLLYDILSRESDEEHPITATYLVKEMRKLGFRTNRIGIHRDVEVLNDNGYLVVWRQEKVHWYKERWYYTEKPRFNLPDVAELIEAVCYCPKLSRARKALLIQKLHALLTSGRGEFVARNIVYADEEYDQHYLRNLEEADTAITMGRKLDFDYCTDEPLPGQRYRTANLNYEPLFLYFEGGRHHLICCGLDGEPVAFRVEWMRNAQIDSVAISERAKKLGEDRQKCIRKLFPKPAEEQERPDE